jgi:hypothetical protein
MSSNQYRAIELAIIPRAAKIPADITALIARETTGLSRRSQAAEWCDRADHIGSLIESALKK